MKPRIGIRATIDGRRLGVRESLEKMCEKMAQAAAEIIEKKCFLWRFAADSSWIH